MHAIIDRQTGLLCNCIFLALYQLLAEHLLLQVSAWTTLIVEVDIFGVFWSVIICGGLHACGPILMLLPSLFQTRKPKAAGCNAIPTVLHTREGVQHLQIAMP